MPDIAMLITESNPLLVQALSDATLTIERGEVSETVPAAPRQRQRVRATLPASRLWRAREG